MSIADIDTTDLYQLYANSDGAARHPLLEREDEQRLGMDVRAGAAARERLESERDPDAQEALKALVRRGQVAREALVTMNQRLVISIASKHRGRGLDFLDLIQEGNLGLMRAIDKFEPERGLKLGTYATPWIHQTILRAIYDCGRTIRVPVHMSERILKLSRVGSALTQGLGREPTREELAAQTGLSLGQVQQALEAAHRTSVSSLNEPLPSDKGYAELGDILPDSTLPAPESGADRRALARLLDEMLETLPPRDRRVIALLYGLDGGQEHTLAEAGRKFGLTRERIRQIETKVLEKLRHPSRSRSLKPYYQ